MSRRRLPPLNALRAFEAAARHLSFTRAAHELHVTPAAISQQIRQLEEHLELRLFRRLPRSLELTSAGRDYLPEVSRGFDSLARATERLKEQELGGPLTVSATFTLAAGWLVPRLPAFRRRFPEIDLYVRAEDTLTDFEDGADLALRYGTGLYPGLRTDLIIRETLFPVCSPSLLEGPTPLRRFRDLRNHVLVHDDAAPNEPWLTWGPWLREMDLRDLLPLKGPRFSSSVMSNQAVLDGQGVGIGRSALVAQSLKEGRLVRPFELTHPADYAYYMVCPDATADQPAIAAFRDWILTEAQGDR